MAVAYTMSDGSIAEPAHQGVKEVREKLKQALSDRKRYEVNWKLNMAFARDEGWTVIDRDSRTLRTIDMLDPRYRERELYKANIINEYRQHTLGELGADDLRPQLLLSRDDQTSEDFQKQLNTAMHFAWDYEAEVDSVMAIADRITIDLGVSAIRCSYDTTVGAVKETDAPHVDGLPVSGDEAVRAAATAMAAGQTLEYKDVLAGKVRVEPLSPFNLITPPGVTHEREFTWEAVVSTMPLQEARELWPHLKDLTEDRDIGSDMGEIASGSGKNSRVKEHVWVYTYYERPCPKYPNGRVLYFVTSNMRFAGNRNQLPYQKPNGEYSSGITYFHYHRLTGRFWSFGLIDPLRDPQRAMNKRRTQMNEIIDKGLPFVLRQRPSEMAEAPKKRTDTPLEIIELPGAGPAPQLSQGIGPGQWMFQEVEQIRLDAERAVGIRGPSLGENPTNVNTYSQLALLREADATKRQQFLRERQMGIRAIAEDIVYDIRTYKGREWHIALAGDDGIVEAHNFDATKIPAFFIVNVPKGPAKPRSQAAEIQKVQDIWQAALGSQVVMQDPSAWVRWYDDSLEAGQVLDLPAVGEDIHGDKARRENHKLMEGQECVVADYDPPDIHIPIHREQQVKAEQAEDWEAWLRLEQHAQEHTQVAQQHAMAVREQEAQAAAAPAEGGMDPTALIKQVQEQAAAQLEEAQQQIAAAQQETQQAQLEIKRLVEEFKSDVASRDTEYESDTLDQERELRAIEKKYGDAIADIQRQLKDMAQAERFREKEADLAERERKVAAAQKQAQQTQTAKKKTSKE